jgi:hypothetical protein
MESICQLARISICLLIISTCSTCTISMIFRVLIPSVWHLFDATPYEKRKYREEQEKFEKQIMYGKTSSIPPTGGATPKK